MKIEMNSPELFSHLLFVSSVLEQHFNAHYMLFCSVCVFLICFRSRTSLTLPTRYV